MSREWTQGGTNSYFTMAAGALAGQTRPFSWAFLIRPLVSGANANFYALFDVRSSATGTTSANSLWACIIDGTSFFHLPNGTGQNQYQNDWMYVGATIPTAAGGQFRWHMRKLVGGVWQAWQHFNGGTMSLSGTISHIRVGYWDSGRKLGHMTAGGFWLSDLGLSTSTAANDAAHEAIGVTALQDWWDANPNILWAFNHATTADTVVDLTGGGADQVNSANAANIAVSATEPPGWSYTISSGITGTLAATEAADTLAASGTVTPPAITGSLAVTEQDDTLAAAGSATPPAITGTAAATEADDVLAASGTVAPPGISGSVAVVEADDTLAAAGTATPPTITGTLQVAEEDDVLAAAGTVSGGPITGTLAITEQDDTLTAVGNLGQVEALIVGAVTGPARVLVTATGPRRVLITATGPRTRRQATGAGRLVRALAGPQTSRTTTGPET